MNTITPVPLQRGGVHASLSLSTEKVLRFIRDYYRSVMRTPTVREIMRYVGVRSTNSVYKHVTKLVEAGLLTKDHVGRIHIPEHTAKTLVLGSAAAGFSSPVEEARGDMVSLDEFLIEKPAQTFLLTVSGDSMIGAGILDGDYILVEQGAAYAPGDIVVVSTDTGYRIKYLAKVQGKLMLRSANPVYKDVPFEDEWTIFGPVISLIRKTHKI